MSNDARFEFVLIEGGSPAGGAPTPMPRERDDLRELLESILMKGGVAIPQGVSTPQTTQAVVAAELEKPRPQAQSISPDAVASPTPISQPVAPPVREAVEPVPIPEPKPRESAPVITQPQPMASETASAVVQPVVQPSTDNILRTEPVPIPESKPLPVPQPLTPPSATKPEPLPSVSVPQPVERPRAEPQAEPLSVPQPVKPDPLQPTGELTPIDRQPTEPSKVPDRFINYPQKEQPPPFTPEDLADMAARTVPKFVDPIQAAEDLARQESADRMRRLAEQHNAEREKRQAEAAAKRKADHENAMQRSDEAIENRYGKPDAKAIFQDLLADAKERADKTVGPSPFQTPTDIIDASVVDAKDAAKATAAKVTGKLAETAGKAAASGAAIPPAVGGVAASAGLAATAATGALAGLAVAAPGMAFHSLEMYTDKLIKSLGDLSPEVAMAQARADAAMTFRRLEMAQQFGPDLARIAEANSDMRVAGSRIGGAFVGPVIREFADIKEGIGNVAEQLGKFVDDNKSFFEQIMQGVMNGTGVDTFGDIGRFLTWMTGGGERQQTFGTYLDELDFLTPPGWDQAPQMDMDAQGGLMLE